MRRKYGDEEVDRKDQSAETHRGRDRRLDHHPSGKMEKRVPPSS